MTEQSLQLTFQGITFEFCWIPPGSFWMGARGSWSAEEPLPREDLPRILAWADSRHAGAVARGDGRCDGGEHGRLLARVVEPGRRQSLPDDILDPSYYKGADRPVEQVRWWDAVVYCERLRELGVLGDEVQGWRFRLPTEAEWEYACRAGTETDYFLGDGEGALSRAGWYDGNSGGETHPVGRRQRTTGVSTTCMGTSGSGAGMLGMTRRQGAHDYPS